MKKAKFDLWWPDIWPDLRNDWNIFVMILYTLSNAAYWVSFCHPGAKFKGAGVFKQPFPTRVKKETNIRVSHCAHVWIFYAPSTTTRSAKRRPVIANICLCSCRLQSHLAHFIQLGAQRTTLFHPPPDRTGAGSGRPNASDNEKRVRRPVATIRQGHAQARATQWLYHILILAV